MKNNFDRFAELVNASKDIVIIQAENPDGDSLGSALALENILHSLGKNPQLYCPVQIPSYLHYIKGWDRVMPDLPEQLDMTIIVDASTLALTERVFSSQNLGLLVKKPLVIIDHHDLEVDLPLDIELLISDPKVVATGELIYQLVKQQNWPLDLTTSELLTQSIMADSLGLTTPNTSVRTVKTVAELMENGVSLAELDNRRRQLSKKTKEIFLYKGELFKRVDFYLEDRLGLVIIPWEDIEKYSDSYNPSVLIIDEVRMVENVEIVVALKTYPDGKITAKIRSNYGSPVSAALAEHFGGGGHVYASGFKLRQVELESTIQEIVKVVDRLLKENHSND